jgi:hypothetical protein
MTLTLPSDLEQRLIREAERQGISVDECAIQLLSEHLPEQSKRAELVDLIQSWIDEGDEEEQRETGDYLIQALDEDRLSNRKLFPSELKGKTW